MSKNIKFINYPIQEVDSPIDSVPKLYTFQQLKNDEDIKKQIIMNELKIINLKMDECNNFLKQIYISVYILLSRDNLNNINLYGVYSSLEKGTEAFNQFKNNDNKIKKIILYKIFVDDIGRDYDVKLFDETNNKNKIYEKSLI
jgi:hypothetical protein